MKKTTSEQDNNLEIIRQNNIWKAPEIPGDIPCGDMPGDKVSIVDGHIAKANVIFPELLKQLYPVLKQQKKGVLTVCGGSGAGKSAIASLLSYYFNQIGIGSYTLSGDNYPRKIPMYNDAERLHVFRESALRGMLRENTYTKERFDIIHKFQTEGDDANTKHLEEYSWYESYLRNGKEGLKKYLGTNLELGFDDMTDTILKFKSGAEKIWLKRMGRTDTELWFEQVDFSDIQILIIEWTHGNSDYYEGVDIPILLNSTPQETMEYRRIRNRDGATDSPFTTMVLEIEQAMLHSQAHKARIILSKSGELLSYEQYCRAMEESADGSKE
ncbi:adenylylsulfate kinase [Anaerocolumna jejuensis]|uniref:adenylylsulfate kinase n=1 Tax=Anaerocolumna jejuensis TaxID=259063 RepID=UPI003F7CCB96